MSDFDQYLEYFPVGLKVTVGIPVPGGTTFHDWAVIHHIDEDLVSLQLSRDVLPEHVRLTVGTIFDIRAGDENTGYSCRAIIVAEGFRREILLRLIGEIVSSELREFYRIDAFLPIRYFISTDQSETRLRDACIAKREARITADRERKEHERKPWQRMLQAPSTEEVPSEELRIEGLWEDTGEGHEPTELMEADTTDHSWDEVVPLAANISGGGVRILIHHRFREDTLVPLEIYLPTEPEHRVIDAVGIVSFANENYAAGKQLQRPSYNTGLKFKFIDERDRDAIVSYISNVQLKRIRLMREQYLFRNSPTFDRPPLTPEQQSRQRIRNALIMLAAALLLTGLVLYFKGYTENRPQHEIERIFNKGYEDYLKKTGRTPP